MDTTLTPNKGNLTWRESLPVIAVLAAMLLIVLTLYTLAHEGGHALVGLLFGGSISDFSVNFFNISAHVGLDGEFTPAQHALIAAAGVSLPLLLALAFVLFAPRRPQEPVAFWFKTLAFVSTVGSLLAWIVIPVLVWQGQRVADDSASFVGYTGLHPLLVSGGALLAFLAAWAVFFARAGSVRAYLADLLAYRTAPLDWRDSRRSLLAVALVGITGAAAAFGLQAAYPGRGFQPPAGYTLVQELDLSARAFSDEVVYTLDLDRPATVTFFITLTRVKGAPVIIEFIKPDGFTSTFFSASDPAFDAGQASLRSDNLALEPGSYRIRVSMPKCRGRAAIYQHIE